MVYRHVVGQRTWVFADLKDLLAKATPLRSGDMLAGIAAGSAEEGMAARHCLADLPLRSLLLQPLIPYDDDDVTRLILDTHDEAAFAPIAHLTVGDFRDWLLSDLATPETLAAIAPGVTPEMAAAVSKVMRNQDLILVARKVRVVTRFRNTIGLPGTMAVRLQPNHPTDDRDGISASIAEGLLYGCGDAVIGINPVSDSPQVLGGSLPSSGRSDRRPRHSDTSLHPHPCDHHDRPHRTRRSGRPRVPVDRRHPGRERLLRRDARLARRSP